MDIEPTDEDIVERVARAICCEGYSCSAERDGNICVAIENWANEARAAIAAIPDRAALVGEVETIRLSNSLLDQFRKSDLEELTTLRSQLAASQADVARLRELTEALSKADGLCTFNRGDHRTIEFAFDEHDDGHKAFELLSDALAAIRDTQP